MTEQELIDWCLDRGLRRGTYVVREFFSRDPAVPRDGDWVMVGRLENVGKTTILGLLHYGLIEYRDRHVPRGTSVLWGWFRLANHPKRAEHSWWGEYADILQLA